MDYCKNCEKSEFVDKEHVYCKRFKVKMKNFDDCNKNLTTEKLIENVKESAKLNYGAY